MTPSLVVDDNVNSETSLYSVWVVVVRDDEKIITINTLRSAGKKRKLQALFWKEKKIQEN